eukprot:15466034-Alexandrium_andersonii.AAC.1
MISSTDCIAALTSSSVDSFISLNSLVCAVASTSARTPVGGELRRGGVEWPLRLPGHHRHVYLVREVADEQPSDAAEH